MKNVRLGHCEKSNSHRVWWNPVCDAIAACEYVALTLHIDSVDASMQ